MNCDWVKSNLMLYVYRELPDDLHYELEMHVGRCHPCALELQELQDFREAVSTVPHPEPTPNLLAASRIRLRDELEGVRQNRTWGILDPMSWLRQVRFSPALAMALLMAGFFVGAGTVWRVGVGNGRQATMVVAPKEPAVDQASIGGIRGITQQPGTDEVEISYDTTTVQKVQGSLNDQRIQQLLLFASRNNTNSGVRMDSVDLLSRKPDDARVRDGLKSALLYDTNPGVRLKALEGLGRFVQDDISVRNAVLEALEEDSNPGVRVEAIGLLQSVRVDSSVRHVLQRLSQQDPNQFIRRQSRRMLATMPEID